MISVVGILVICLVAASILLLVSRRFSGTLLCALLRIVAILLIFVPIILIILSLLPGTINSAEVPQAQL